MKVAIIGGGAAGFFAAISAKKHHPDAEVTIYEKSSKLLAKVKISGGGRCNVTNVQEDIRELLQGYPRGAKLLKQAFREFSTADTKAWFESKGVKLKAEDDGRMFPTSDDSQTIIDCLLRTSNKHGIRIKTHSPIEQLTSTTNGFELVLKSESMRVNKVIVATGGSPKIDSFEWLEKLGNEIIPPTPSLFTFNMPKNPVTALQGVVCPQTVTKIQGTKLQASGSLLITHWGMSGPAILKLSSFGALMLRKKKYDFTLQVNWVNGTNDQELAKNLNGIIDSNPRKLLTNIRPYELPTRLWEHLLSKREFSKDKVWGELGKKGVNKLASLLTNDKYPVLGKTTFKEEFVTCGGISMSSINQRTLESKSCPGLYFAGEVLDIDGITGGYNFQAAWTTGWIAGKLG